MIFSFPSPELIACASSHRYFGHPFGRHYTNRKYAVRCILLTALDQLLTLIITTISEPAERFAGHKVFLDSSVRHFYNKRQT
jgi:hypothetical protein